MRQRCCDAAYNPPVPLPSGTRREDPYTPKLAGLDDLGSSLITLTVYVDVLRANVRAILDYVKPSNLICVVKANAYGFGISGLVPVFNEFENVSLAVATPDEALELLTLGYAGRIILMGYTHPKCYYQIMKSDCQLSAYRLEHIPLLASAARERGRPLELHIKVDTGLTRLGVKLDDLQAFTAELKRHPELNVVGLFSHLADSSDATSDINDIQARRFMRAIEIVSSELGYKPECHLANSMAVINFPELHLDSVRVGTFVYGMAPLPGLLTDESLVNYCFKLSSEIIDIHRVEPGQGVSYTHSWRAGRKTTIVTFPFGYADGLPRRLSNNMDVLIHGQRVKQVGNISMDYVMANAGNMDVKIGDEVVIIGSQDAAEIPIEEVAQRANTLSYEIACAWGRRVRRVYVDR
jgi:alanine racemase